MSDWQVGDLAVCVDARNSHILKEGATYTVTAYFHDPALNRLGVFSEYSLLFREISPGRNSGFCETRFRKILPDKAEQCEPEFVTLLKRIKRTVPASAMSASGQDAQRLEAKPASAVPERQTPEPIQSPPLSQGDE